MCEISVVTCTHNPKRDYLEATINALARQSLSTDRWEYLLIDNASHPDRRPIVDLTWHPQARMIREETLGLTPARLRGIRESLGKELLVFVDDDNVLDPNYLEQAITVAEEKPFLGSWSGQCRPRFDEAPPEWTRRYWGILVIREFDRDVWSNLPRLAETMPCGAGLCVRRQVAEHYMNIQERRHPVQLDRKGDSLVSGGDNDLAACACDLGLGVGLVASLKLTHLIPSQKLSVEYLTRLAEGVSFSSVLLDADRNIEMPERTILRKVLDQLRLLRLRNPHREIMEAVYRGRAKAQAELSRQR